MTNIDVFMKENTVIIKAKGHATGNNSVCGAISGMMFALEAWLVNNKDLVRKHSFDFDEGESRIEFIPVESESFTVLEFVLIGLYEFEQNYREYMKLNISDDISHLLRTRF